MRDETNVGMEPRRRISDMGGRLSNGFFVVLLRSLVLRAASATTDVDGVNSSAVIMNGP